MSRKDFRAVYLPYCIDRMKDGKYVVLNRTYKPLGFITSDILEYQAYPISAEIQGITPTVAAKLSWKGDSNVERIYLYNDGCIPTESDANMDAYLDRLKILAKLKLKPQIA
ncbi:hypothetical protein [Nitrosomonas communis]|uniref:Uncharacterized protein n=1 Tax=Nitrosomonas communis TaxID=44574 RepID=A0A1I4RVY1_9PROT|nr:hypothetical protein [Nitrosomonas communis]SFM56396.1 hypothetical protein SAMN05421863_103547 [Nitrosomonas communis]